TVEFGGRTGGAPRTRWLRTSAEFPMKRLLAEGIGDCYELGRVFRDGEAGGRHNPEFTMLEWYRVGWTLAPLIEETAALVQAALALVGRGATLRTASFREVYQEALGLDPMSAPLADLQAAFRGDIDPEGLTRDDWLDLLMTHRIQPAFPAGSCWRCTTIRPRNARWPGWCAAAMSTWPSASSSTSDRWNWPTATTNSPTRPSSRRASNATTRCAPAAAWCSRPSIAPCWGRSPPACRSVPASRWASTAC